MASISLCLGVHVRLPSETPETVLCWLLGPGVCVSTFWGHSCQSWLAQHSDVGTAGSGLPGGLLPLNLESALCAWAVVKAAGQQNSPAQYFLFEPISSLKEARHHFLFCVLGKPRPYFSIMQTRNPRTKNKLKPGPNGETHFCSTYLGLISCDT